MLNKITLGTILLVLIGFSEELHAQEFRKFMVFAGAGNSNTFTTFPIQSIEPSLWLKKSNAILGLRIEIFDRPLVEKCYSYTLNYQYNLTKRHSPFLVNKVSVFVGLGAGTYVARNENLIVTYPVIGGVHGRLSTFVANVNNGRVGFYPRVALIYKHVSLIFDYNLIYREHLTNTYIFQTATTEQMWTTTYYRSENYFSFKIGYFFYRKKK